MGRVGEGRRRFEKKRQELGMRLGNLDIEFNGQPKERDDGAIQTLSLSKTFSKDSQLSFKEATRPF